jgi:uncharacterized protein YukE
MVDNGFQADPTTITRHATEFAGYADRIGAAHRELTAALEAAGPCWGDDPAGRSFADGHRAPAAGTLDRIAELPDRLNDVGDRFAATAAGYQRVDEHGADLLTGER